MAKVVCEVEEIDDRNDSGNLIPSVCVTCGECGEQTKSFGQGEKSVKRCLVLLKENCPRDETNYYVVDED